MDPKEKIENLDKIIADNAHVLYESELYQKGGLHDMLFMLKSLDLDMKMGYPLGTIFGYGYDSDKRFY